MSSNLKRGLFALSKNKNKLTGIRSHLLFKRTTTYKKINNKNNSLNKNSTKSRVNPNDQNNLSILDKLDQKIEDEKLKIKTAIINKIKEKMEYAANKIKEANEEIEDRANEAYDQILSCQQAIKFDYELQNKIEKIKEGETVLDEELNEEFKKFQKIDTLFKNLAE